MNVNTGTLRDGRLVTNFHDMLSTPTARPTSIWPARISFAIVVTAIRPEEQKRFRV
jgi:hypothetical protein